MIHTAVMFLCVTIHTAINLNIVTASYVNNREFTGTDELRPGPLGYQNLAFYETTGVISTVMFLLNNWLADGLLVNFTLGYTTQESDVGHQFSFIVVTPSMP